MHRINCCSGVALAFVLLLTPICVAMNMPHYDVDSLVYLSTDIVIAKVSQDDAKNLSARVTETLYGSLQPGDRVERLAPFLTFFQPMVDGMNVVLFLDRRPHQYGFVNSDAAKSPFAVLPSGVYLIDEYGHSHEYFQVMNPGPYVAHGYMYFPEKSVPTKEEDLALPSLDEVKRRIAIAIKTVQPVRSLLDKTASIDDGPALLRLVDTTSDSDKDCDLRMAAAINERGLDQIRSLNSAELLLRAYAIANNSQSSGYALSFVESMDLPNPSGFEVARVKYLIDMLSNNHRELALRVAAVQMLLQLSKFHPGPQNGPSRALPIDNRWLIDFAKEIQATSRKIFDDPSQAPKLRGLCLQFLSLDQPKIVADVRRVHKHTRSDELRFAIEKSLIAYSKELYENLNPIGGPVTSRIKRAPECECVKRQHASMAFLMEYREGKDFRQRQPSIVSPHPALMNLQTHQRVRLENVHVLWGWQSIDEGQSSFELGQLSGVPPGKYYLALEYRRDDNSLLSSGYGVEITIRATSSGNEVSVKEAAGI